MQRDGSRLSVFWQVRSRTKLTGLELQELRLKNQTFHEISCPGLLQELRSTPWMKMTLLVALALPDIKFSSSETVEEPVDGLA
jgi:hypothetical protein